MIVYTINELVYTLCAFPCEIIVSGSPGHLLDKRSLVIEIKTYHTFSNNTQIWLPQLARCRFRPRTWDSLIMASNPPEVSWNLEPTQFLAHPVL